MTISWSQILRRITELGQLYIQGYCSATRASHGSGEYWSSRSFATWYLRLARESPGLFHFQQAIARTL